MEQSIIPSDSSKTTSRYPYKVVAIILASILLIVVVVLLVARTEKGYGLLGFRLQGLSSSAFRAPLPGESYVYPVYTQRYRGTESNTERAQMMQFEIVNPQNRDVQLQSITFKNTGSYDIASEKCGVGYINNPVNTAYMSDYPGQIVSSGVQKSPSRDAMIMDFALLDKPIMIRGGKRLVLAMFCPISSTAVGSFNFSISALESKLVDGGTDRYTFDAGTLSATNICAQDQSGIIYDGPSRLVAQFPNRELGTRVYAYSFKVTSDRIPSYEGPSWYRPGGFIISLDGPYDPTGFNKMYFEIHGLLAPLPPQGTYYGILPLHTFPGNPDASQCVKQIPVTIIIP